MKDITIFENFINDEELEEARQFIGEESLNLDNKDYGNILNIFQIMLLARRSPSVRNFILKMKNRIDKYTNTNFKIELVYFNRQVRGQDVALHTDADNFNDYTLLIYIGDITPENYDKAGGDLELKTKEITRIEPFAKRAVLFRGYIPHQAYAPLVPGITRILMAFKLTDTSNELPFIVNYG
tara:strand:- start:43 stop:588 length:546 start_codon:yes stop_codon:yes gene_type:complete